jgi:peptidoglycan hydrolase-like protein with peptidoglycan-binding domain
MGNTTLANQVAQQYNIVIPNQVVTPMTNIIPTFSRYLQLGQIGNDVKQLQIFLNSKGYIISSTGPGSKGNETTMFGSLTKKALMKFQKDNKIPSTGYFGPMTRKFVNEGR